MTKQTFGATTSLVERGVLELSYLVVSRSTVASLTFPSITRSFPPHVHFFYFLFFAIVCYSPMSSHYTPASDQRRHGPGFPYRPSPGFMLLLLWPLLSTPGYILGSLPDRCSAGQYGSVTGMGESPSVGPSIRSVRVSSNTGPFPCPLPFP